MLRNLGDASVGDDKGELLNKINEYLLGKRFLIVMDNVWSLDVTWWLRICEALPKGNGSSITTRIEKVAQKMGVKEARSHWPKCLSKDDSDGGECMHPELENVGKEIVERCKGLPLAIKAVGGIMLCKPSCYHEWRRIADHFRERLVENDNSVMAFLQLSYDELPSYLKSCFLCLSLYPEDCVITKDQLVHWWLGEGFIPLRNGRSAIAAEEDCFSRLTNRCLLEVVDKTYHGAISTCKIHDMVRDVTGEVNKIASNTTKKFCDSRILRAMDLSRLGLLTFQCGTNTLNALPQHPCSDTMKEVEVSFKYLPKGLGRLSNLGVLLGYKPTKSKQLEDCRIDKLFPPQQLHELSLKFYPRKISPAWLNPISLPILRYLSISSGNLAKDE
ncbi:hypothetical protein PRUPE_6G150700 [Prunus persica]|uniref:Uncharacterized protein n=1 Tax=Prunus persica TaxID=3760 RepID=A0A251NQR8_PRUPE|nr:hypothetical protein PRUPE_6G150700 [Prunus persica]